MTTLLEDLQNTGDLAETNLKNKGVDCEFGKASESKDTLYDLADKIEDIGVGFEDTGLIKWDASKQATFKTVNGYFVIGVGGGYVDYGDGMIEQLNEGNHTFNHTYTDATKIYDIRISNVTKFISDNTNSSAQFANMVGLLSVYLPILNEISAYESISVFEACSNLKSINFPLLTSIKTTSTNSGGYLGMCYGCSSLIEIHMPLLEEILCANSSSRNTASFFIGCTNLEYINLASLENLIVGLENKLFTNCNNLKYVILSSLSLIKAYQYTSSTTGMFSLTSAPSSDTLEFVDLSGLITISHSTTLNLFKNRNPKIIKFGAATPPTINNSASFSSMSGGVVIVPSDSLSAYKSAANYPSSTTNTYVGV